MTAQGGAGHPFSADPDWESDLIEKVATCFPKLDKEELRADLAATLLKEKRRQRVGICNPKAYLTTCLFNRAKTLARKQAIRDKHETRTEWPDEATEGLPVERPPPESAVDTRRRARRQLAEIRRVLDADSYAFLQQLDEAGNNQSLLARRWGVHRNTIVRRLQRIRRTLIRCPIENVTAQEREDLVSMAHDARAAARSRFKAWLILALVAGQSYDEIAAEFHTSRPTISRWKHRFQKNGIAGLKAKRPGKKPHAGARKRIADWLRRTGRIGKVPSCRTIGRALRLSKSTVQRILRERRS